MNEQHNEEQQDENKTFSSIGVRSILWAYWCSSLADRISSLFMGVVVHTIVQ